MNAYQNTIDTLYDLLINDPEINTVTKGNSRNGIVDIEKKNNFPLAHVNVISSNFENATINFKIAVLAMDLRNLNKSTDRDKWKENDNENDNLDRMLYVIHRLWQKLRILDNGITLSSTEDPEPFTEWGNNVVDGWVLVFDVTVIETDSGAC